MEKNEISVHEVLVWSVFLSHPDKWMSNTEVLKMLPESATVQPRTARHHTRKLVQLGLLDQMELFPAHRYRLSSVGDKRNLGYSLRLKQALEVLQPGFAKVTST
jgi:hypothetical protein